MRVGSPYGPSPAIEILAIQPTSQDGGISADFYSTVQADARHLALLRGTGRTERFALGAGGVIGREAAAVKYHLNHPRVSRVHASLAVDGERVVLADLSNFNGTICQRSAAHQAHLTAVEHR